MSDAVLKSDISINNEYKSDNKIVQEKKKIDGLIARIEKDYEELTEMDKAILTNIYNQYPEYTVEQYKKLYECRCASGCVVAYNPKAEAETFGLESSYPSKMTMSAVKEIFLRVDSVKNGKRGDFV